MVRLILAAFSALVGLVCAALSLSALSVVGADDIVETEPLRVHDGSYALVINPQLVPFANSTAEVHVTGPAEMFMGTASGVDVESYLTGIAHEEVTAIEMPGAPSSRFVAGEPAPVADAAGRDWWTHSQTGTDLRHSFSLDADSGEVIVLAPADPKGSLDGATATVEMDAGGVFPASLAGLGIALLAFGAAAFFFLRWRDFRPGRGRRLRNARRRGQGQDPDQSSGGRGRGLSSLLGQARGRGQARSQGQSRTRNQRSSQGQSRTRNRRTSKGLNRAAAAGAALSLFAVTGCSALPLAQPSTPDLTPFERPALREGEAGKFLTSYTERLDKALSDDPEQLDKIQAAPLLDRTRAEVLIAAAAKRELSAVNFSQVVAGGPNFSSYPMWFIAFGKPAENDEQVQAMLVTRESAGRDWQVTQSLFVPAENVPTLLADGTGAVETSGKEFGEVAGAADEALQEYLETGKIPETEVPVEYASDAFTGFRGYVDELAKNKDAFEKTTVTCDPYDEPTVPLASHALRTETGDVSFGEVRCAIELQVRAGGAIDVGDELKAVMNGDLDGGKLVISTSIPYMLLGAADTNLVVGSDWFLLSAQTA